MEPLNRFMCENRCVRQRKLSLPERRDHHYAWPVDPPMTSTLFQVSWSAALVRFSTTSEWLLGTNTYTLRLPGAVPYPPRRASCRGRWSPR